MTTIFTRLDPAHFTDAAQRDPDGVAVEAGDRALTFGEVDTWAERVADALIALGAGPDAHVVMALSPSVESFVSVWAVAKTGASLASVDPSDMYAPVGVVLGDPRITVGIATRAQRRLVGDAVNWLVLETVFEGSTEVAA